MWAHPIVSSFAFVFATTVVRTAILHLSFGQFVTDFLYYPYWIVLLIFLLFWVVRAVQASFLFRYARTVRVRHQQVFAQRSQAVTTATPTLGAGSFDTHHGDLTSASPLESPGGRLPFHTRHGGVS